MRSIRASLAGCVATVLVLASAMPAQQRRALDHSDYDRWNRITGQTLSDDGRWVAYTLAPGRGDGELRVRATRGEAEHRVERGTGGEFAAGGAYVIFRIRPAEEALEAARREGRRGDRLPPDTLGILDLRTGEVTRIGGLRAFTVPSADAGWIAYHLRAERDEAPADDRQAERRGGGQNADAGTPLVLRTLRTGAEQRIEHVASFSTSDNARLLAFVRATPDENGDGLYVMQPPAGAPRAVLTGAGEYRQLALDDAGSQLAVLSNRETKDDDQPAFVLYHWRDGTDAATALARDGAAGIPDGWWVSQHGSLSFSETGRRLFFGTSPRPEPEPEPLPEDERVIVDIWHWQDPLIQPHQIEQLDGERRRNYRAVVHLDAGNRIVQLASEDLPSVNVGGGGEADVAVGTSSLPYQILRTWDGSYSDVYVVDVRTGERRQILEMHQGGVQLSPDEKYAAWWDRAESGWLVKELADGQVRNVSAAIPTPVYREDDDRPREPASWGNAGWTRGDAEFLIYDEFDVWAVDPAGRASPRNVTGGLGRTENLRLRLVRLDREERSLDPNDQQLFSSFDLATKAEGFYRARLRDARAPQRLVVDDRSFSTPRKADDADVLLFTRSRFEEFPDLWVSDLSFGDMRRLSDANPQQAEYRWGTAELVEWTSSHGEPHQGILYKPEGFDPSRQYPMIVYFYERLSQRLHSYSVPSAGASSVSIPFYVSRGYLVFTPDVVYREGYPGESAMTSLVPGVTSLVDRGFVDRDRIGIQGHSWGGYQITYLITRTNLFRAAVAGAPVVNMFSAYSGIRWGTGLARQFQYETGQSRIGGSIWEKPLRYLENSPIFWADKVETPVMMMHNDAETAVPWEEGIQFYLALRRLDKPVWLLNYNDEPHSLRRRANREDWAIRMQQFFDYYLMDAPPPVWLVQGVPALHKGRTLGLELVEEDPPVAAGGDRDGGN